MKRISLLVVVLTAVAVGCNKPKQTVSTAPPRDASATPQRSMDTLMPEAPVEEAPTTGVPVAPVPSGTMHLVTAKDTLWSLAARYLGDGQRWQEIVKANPGLNPNALPVGKTIVIPAK